MRGPSHLGLATADEILELVVELGTPVKRLGGGRGATDGEVFEGIVVGLAVEVLRFEDDAVAVKDEGLEWGGGGGGGDGQRTRGAKTGAMG